MKRFFIFLKTELKLSLRDMNMPIFAVIMPLVIFVILGILYGEKPAFDGASYTFLEQSFGAACAIAICAGGLMGLPQAISDSRERKVLKRFRVTPVSPVFLLGVEMAMYIVYCAASLGTLAIAAIFWKVRLQGSLSYFLGSWLLTMVSTLSVGLLVGGVAKNTKQAGVIASILYFPMLVFFRHDAPHRSHAPGDAEDREPVPPDAGHLADEKHVFTHESRECTGADLRDAWPHRALRGARRPVLSLGIVPLPLIYTSNAPIPRAPKGRAGAASFVVII